jgi:hypothetical protein
LLSAVEDFDRPLPETQPCPYGALVVAADFGEVADDDLWRLSVWLVVTGCMASAFHGALSSRAEDFFDEAAVIVKIALEGDVELQREISEAWPHPLEESGATRWGVGFMSTSHTPEEESLAETVELGFLGSEPVERPIAIPLDARSATALREVFRETGA